MRALNRKSLHITEKLKLNHLLLMNTIFFPDTINLQKKPRNLVNISQVKNEPSNWNITLSSNHALISYKIDIGVQCNVIPVESLENIFQTRSLTSKCYISAYNGRKIPVVGNCSLTLAHKNNYFKV